MIPPAAAPRFLAQHGWTDAKILPLAGDASFRRYFRVIDRDRRAVLMDAPPEHEDVRPFVHVATHLAGIGFRAPTILASDLSAGLVLLEDFGDDRMREVVDAEPAREEATYTAVVELLAALHRHPAAELPAYSRTELQREAGLFVEWYCPAVGLVVQAEGYRAAWDRAIGRLTGARTVTVLRDYHAENIMLIEGASGRDALGLLDFQDALAGPPAYDLVSLLQDARRDVAPELEARMRTVYAALADTDADFDAAYAILGAQRNAKILGIFTRLWKRDGKPRYLSYLPRVWGYLERDLQHEALVDVAAWFAANVLEDKRAGFWA